jgi:hypothetical protein
MVWYLIEDGNKHISTARIMWLTLFREIIAIYSGNHTKAIHVVCGPNAEFLIIKADGTHSYHWDLNFCMCEEVS